MKATVGNLGLLAFIAGCESSGEDSVPNTIWVAGTATVAPGLIVPPGGQVFSVLAPVDRTLETLACTSVDTPGVEWYGGPRVAEGELSWGTYYPPVLRQIHGYAVIAADAVEANRRIREERMPPVHAGALYGASRIIDVPQCDSLPASESTCFGGSFIGEHMVIDRVFSGCP
jgi:hypothetical protein